MLDVKRLRVLSEVAKRGSFSAAAAALGYTQPAISRQVALLEQETGATLLERGPGGVRLTDAGSVLVDHAQAILARLEDAEHDLRELMGLEAGRLRMSTLTSAAATIVPLAVTEFRRRLPGVELSVSMLEPPAVLPALRSGDVDLALCNDAGHLDLPDIEAVRLFDEPIVIALPPDHPLAKRRRVRLAELAGETWMLSTAQSCPDAGRFTRACHSAGFDPQIAFQHDDYSAVLGFVAAGVGAAPVPEMIARTARPGVHIVSLGRETFTRTIVASMPCGYRPRAAQAMLEVLRDVSEDWKAGANRHQLQAV